MLTGIVTATGVLSTSIQSRMAGTAVYVTVRRSKLFIDDPSERGRRATRASSTLIGVADQSQARRSASIRPAIASALGRTASSST